jgi:hypothetical protein
MLVPRLSNMISRENEASRLRKRASRGSSRGDFHVGNETRHQNQVGRSVADHLISDADRAALGILRLQLHHSALQPRTVRQTRNACNTRTPPAPTTTEAAGVKGEGLRPEVPIRPVGLDRDRCHGVRITGIRTTAFREPSFGDTS